MVARDPARDDYPVLDDRPAPGDRPAPDGTPATGAPPPVALLDRPRPSAAATAPLGVITAAALASDPYRPTALLDLIVRFLWGTCSVPGCDRPAFACDLDHVQEFDQLFPHRGGPTCLCNLAPKCRYHHLMKTYLDGFLDDLWLGTDGRYRMSTTVPGGLTRETVAPNHWLLPQLDRLRCRHRLDDRPTPPAATAAGDPGPQRRRTRTEAKHSRRRAERARNRRERELAETLDAVAVSDALTRRLRAAEVHAYREFDNPPPF